MLNATMQPNVAVIAFNEANMELLKKYLSKDEFNDRLPALERYTSLPTVITTSEENYEQLEPWIKWTSVHTGMTAEEHNVFRLGDISISEQ